MAMTPEEKDFVAKLERRLNDLERKFNTLLRQNETRLAFYDPKKTAGGPDSLRERMQAEAKEAFSRATENPDRQIVWFRRYHRLDTGRLAYVSLVAHVLRYFRDPIKEVFRNLHPDGAKVRVKFRGSLVRGLKTYHKGALDKVSRFDPTDFDCDAFLEIPNDVWKLFVGARFKRIVPGGTQTKYIDQSRKYEALSSIDLNNEKSDLTWREALKKLREIEGYLKSGLRAVPGYRRDKSGNADFEFYLRPVENVWSVYEEGNPYFVGQVPTDDDRPVVLGRSREFNLRMKANVPLDSKKPTDTEEMKSALEFKLQEYSWDHGVMSDILPDFQGVVGREAWYLEDESLFKAIMAQRELTCVIGSMKRSSMRSLSENGVVCGGVYDADKMGEVARYYHELLKGGS